MLKIGILKEESPLENRVAITPKIASMLQKLNCEIFLEKNAGINAGFPDSLYANATINNKEETIKQSQIILKVNSLSNNEVALLTNNHIVIANLNVTKNPIIIEEIKQKKAQALALELMPRISRAQSMDILSSQNNLKGYFSVISGNYHSKKVAPLMMSAAGSIIPSKIFIIGVGVAGLQAIATAKRLGCNVSAYDVREETKEQTTSLGASFAPIKKDTYKEDFINHINKQDVIISTVISQGKNPSPILITKDMISDNTNIKCIVDVAIQTGGNFEGTKKDEITKYKNITIIGENLVNYLPGEASELFAKNIYNLIYAYYNKETHKLDLSINDEIINTIKVV